MKHLHFVILLLAFLAPVIILAAAPPNVIVILADDLGYRDVGIQGCEDFPTPHMDSIATSGVRCTDAYVTAPVCSPSRAGLLTGRYQNRFGFEFLVSPDAAFADGKKAGLATGEKTFADRMKSLGYVTGCIGKWHLGDEAEYLPMSRGFDEFYGSPGQSNYFSPLIIDSSKSAKPTKIKTPGYYLTEDFGKQAVSFVERHKDCPFFLYLPHFAVHKPYEATEAHLAQYAHIKDEKRRAFAGMATALDDAVGALLGTLRQHKLEENTLIFFFSDNGGTGGVGDNLPLRGGKGSSWEGGIRTPFFVQWKGRLAPGKIYSQPVSSLDILPTALAAAGGQIDPAWKLDGVNLLPFLEDEAQGSPHEALFWRFGPQRAVRQGEWKWVQSREGRGGSIQIAKTGPPRLFNLKQDAAEKDDVSGAHPEKAAELQHLWEQWNQQLPEPSWHPGAEE